MGNRRTDPYSQKLEHICESSEGWPQFTRVFPILNWSYSEVWQFLKFNQLSYCHLYDQGYTSLGEKNNSQKNPMLKKNVLNSVNENVEYYLPAYCL